MVFAMKITYRGWHAIKKKYKNAYISMYLKGSSDAHFTQIDMIL